jgi:hypothetical protein
MRTCTVPFAISLLGINFDIWQHVLVPRHDEFSLLGVFGSVRTTLSQRLAVAGIC